MRRIYIFLILIFSATVMHGQVPKSFFGDAELTVESVDEINTISSEIAPCFVDNMLYYSGIPERYFKSAKRRKKNTAFYQALSVGLNANGNILSVPQQASGFGGEMHEGPVDYCDKTGELFVTLSRSADEFDGEQTNREGLNKLRLVIKKQVDGKWMTTEELPFNDPNFNFAHPAISTTGDTLIFSSDLDSLNYGNTDLFMSVRNNGQWSEPQNLGEYINSPGNEVFPTLLPGGFFTFATNGRTIQKGGLDIYYTSFPEMDEVEIFGEGINTEFDDFGLILHRNEKVGYFTSNRNKKNSDDIFILKIE